MTWTCGHPGCGEVFTSFDRAERHARAARHSRITVDVELRERRP